MDATPASPLTQSRRATIRLVMLSGFMLFVAWMLIRSELPGFPFWDGGWPAMPACGIGLIFAGQFLVGMWQGPKPKAATRSDWIDQPVRKPRRAWGLVLVGSGLMLAYVLGRVLVDHATARDGGLAGLAQSLGLLLSGFLLVSWGVQRPAWLFVKDEAEL